MEIRATNFVVEPSHVSGDKLTLVGEEARHLAKVLRARPGDVFYAIDGSGVKYRVVVESVSGRSVRGIVSGTTRLENEPCHHITLAHGLCRPAKMDDIVARGTEIGVRSFIFYFSEKSYSRMEKETSCAKKLSRARRIVRAASKQCGRSIIPEVRQLLSLKELLLLRPEYDLSLIAVSRPQSKALEDLIDGGTEPRKILLLVGPESGFSDDEVLSAANAGFALVKLGPRRLRTETAGIVFPALVLSYLGDL